MARVRSSEHAVAVDGRRIVYWLVRVPGRRSVELSVTDRAALELRAPYHFPRSEGASVVSAHWHWVCQALDGAHARMAERAHRLRPGAVVPCAGERLVLATDPGGRRRVRREGRSLLVSGDAPGTWPEPEQAQRLLERWYREQARAHFASRIPRLAAPLGVGLPRKVVVRAQRTRWGSCSSSGALSLNWRLLLLELRLSDYVLVHELCHLAEMNHSARFWSRVARLIPDHQARRHELRDAQLHLPL